MAPKKEAASSGAEGDLPEEFHDSEEGEAGKLPPVPESPEALGEEADVRVIIANLQEKHEVELKIVKTSVNDLKQQMRENKGKKKKNKGKKKRKRRKKRTTS